MMKSIFSQLNTAKLRIKNGGGLFGNASKRLELLEQIEDLIRDGKFGCPKNLKKFADNMYMHDDDIASLLGISQSGVRQFKRRLSNSVIKELGENVVEDILYGEKDVLRMVERKLIVASADISSRDIVCNTIIDSVKDGNSKNLSYNLEDCSAELRYISKFSNRAMKSALYDLDISKVSYIISILDGDVGTLEDKVRVINFIQKCIRG